mmetsp:Transcript_16827/g.46408  ORF Transcript_16827/g.46408 Transcript_16827/m.46408 type:complete len:217 (-) Transcript_16827:658-1308(-)
MMCHICMCRPCNHRAQSAWSPIPPIRPPSSSLLKIWACIQACLCAQCCTRSHTHGSWTHQPLPLTRPLLEGGLQQCLINRQPQDLHCRRSPRGLGSTHANGSRGDLSSSSSSSSPNGMPHAPGMVCRAMENPSRRLLRHPQAMTCCRLEAAGGRREMQARGPCAPHATAAASPCRNPRHRPTASPASRARSSRLPPPAPACPSHCSTSLSLGRPPV